MWYAFQVAWSRASGPVRKSHWLTMPCAREYDITSATLMASGLASTPSSWTFSPALPSSSFASTMLWVVSGQIVVHSESVNARMTTLPRNWFSDIGWPNWFTSVMSGAGALPSEEPRSRLGLASAAAFAASDAEAEGCGDGDPQPASTVTAARMGMTARPALARYFLGFTENEATPRT